MATYTEIEVIAHHHPEVGGISGDTLTDFAREQGLIYACLDCGTVGGISTDLGYAHALGYDSVERARSHTRDNLDVDNLCCDHVILY